MLGGRLSLDNSLVGFVRIVIRWSVVIMVMVVGRGRIFIQGGVSDITITGIAVVVTIVGVGGISSRR